MKRNYKVVIKNGRGQEVKQVVNGVWYDLTSEQARWMVLGIAIGIKQAYKGGTVELYDADTEQLIFVQH